MYKSEPSFMKLGLAVVWRDCKEWGGFCGSELSKWEKRTRMIYTIPQKFMFQSTKSNFMKPEVKGKSRKRGYRGGAPAGDVWGSSHPKGCSCFKKNNKPTFI